jgi:rsbT co-antagonist protein RsbR
MKPTRPTGRGRDRQRAPETMRSRITSQRSGTGGGAKSGRVMPTPGQDVYRYLVDSVEDYGIYMLDAEGRIITWNRGAQRIKGYTADEIIGKNYSILFTDADQAAGKPQQELDAARRDGHWEDEAWRVRKDGSQFWASVVLTPVRDADGTARGFVKVTRDLTARKNVEDELRKARAELERRVEERTADLKSANDTLQAQVAQRQRMEVAIRELSTPVLPVRERMLLLPVVGVIDSLRARQLTENLLRALRTYRAKVAVLDLTGVPVVDSKVANHLIQTVEAARLLGAMVIITGLSPEIAQTLVTVGVDLSRVTTVGDLRGGLEMAELMLGYRVVVAQARAAGGPLTKGR